MKIKFFYISCLVLVSVAVATAQTKRIEFNAPESYPEGVTYDKTTNAYYVTSARLGTVGKVTPEGLYSVIYSDNTLKSTYGVKVHPTNNRLYVCVADANYSKYTEPATRKKMSRLISIDLTSKKKVMDVNLATLLPGEHFANDLTFDDKGNAYITDSYANAIYKVTPDGKASVFAKNKLFDTKGVGLNGIVWHPGGFLIVDSSNKGSIFKVSIANPQNVQKVKIDQFFPGADGLLLRDNTLTLVQNQGTDKIFQLTSSDNWQTAKLSANTLAADRFAYPSTAAMNGDEVWVMNAKFGELVDSNMVPSKKFAIQQAVFKPVVQ